MYDNASLKLNAHEIILQKNIGHNSLMNQYLFYLFFRNSIYSD